MQTFENVIWLRNQMTSAKGITTHKDVYRISCTKQSLQYENNCSVQGTYCWILLHSVGNTVVTLRCKITPSKPITVRYACSFQTFLDASFFTNKRCAKRNCRCLRMTSSCVHCNTRAEPGISNVCPHRGVSVSFEGFTIHHFESRLKTRSAR